MGEECLGPDADIVSVSLLAVLCPALGGIHQCLSCSLVSLWNSTERSGHQQPVSQLADIMHAAQMAPYGPWSEVLPYRVPFGPWTEVLSYIVNRVPFGPWTEVLSYIVNRVTF